MTNKKTDQETTTKRYILVLSIIAFAIVGVLLLTAIRAATSSVNVEPDSNSVDSAAYNGDFLLFQGNTNPNPGGEYTAELIADTTGFNTSGPYNTHKEAGGAPWGLHEAPLSIPEWGFKRGPLARADYQTFFRPTIEWRGAVFAEDGTAPKGNFKVQMRNMSYYSFVSGNWQKEFDVAFNSSGNGAFLGAGPGGNPYDGVNFGQIPWANIGNGIFEAQWKGNQLMHFWAGRRHPVRSGQTAELAVGEIRIIGLNGQPVDTVNNKVLAQIGIDYYNVGENNNKAPGPGIGRYYHLDDEWRKLAWVTTPKGTPITFNGTVNWLNNNPPPVFP